jgi:hypothetical protein
MNRLKRLHKANSIKIRERKRRIQKESPRVAINFLVQSVSALWEKKQPFRAAAGKKIFPFKGDRS